ARIELDHHRAPASHVELRAQPTEVGDSLMNKQLKFLSRTVFGMFIVLFFSVTMIQFVSADELRDNELNQRSIKNSYKVERGSILVDGNPIAFSTPTDDEFRFIRQYADGPLYAPIT